MFRDNLKDANRDLCRRTSEVMVNCAGDTFGARRYRLRAEPKG